MDLVEQAVLDPFGLPKPFPQVKQDGTALTLTNSVRILYDDALPSRLLSVLLHRIADKINETEAE